MKVFWALIAVVVLGAGGVFAFQYQQRWRATTQDNIAKQSAAQAVKIERQIKDSMDAIPQAPQDKVAEKPVEKPAEPVQPAPETPAAPKPEVKPESPKAPPATEAPKADAPKTQAPDVKPPEKKKPVEQGIGTYDIIPGEIIKQEDGTLLVNKKFKIKGEGTREAPYEISWDLLVTAEQTYEPKSNKKKMPQGIAMLDGKWVKINSYVAFPIAAASPRELLSMLNQWDGCCIGVPPTPYDAIEVRLKEAAQGENRFATMGSVTGVFGVQPYLVGDWLVGLYVMDDATMTPEKYGGFGN